MRLVAKQIHPAPYTWHAEEHPPRSNFWGQFALNGRLCCSPVICALIDRSGALIKTLPVSRFPPAFVTGLESRLIHPRKLTRHDAVIFTASFRNCWRERREIRSVTYLHRSHDSLGAALA